MRYFKFLIPAFMVMLAPPSRAKDDDTAAFETWEEHVSLSTGSQHGPPVADPPSAVAKPDVVGQTNNPSAPEAQVKNSVPTADESPEDSPGDYLVHFGAGARWLVPLRLSDGARDDKLLSVFSMSIAPFRIIGEVGVDVAIGRDSSFFLQPNLKFFFVKHEIISVYLEGSFALYSQPAGTHLGGGAGIGIVGGLMQHLSIELRASAVALNLNGADSALLLGTPPDAASGDATLIVCPSLEARIMARF